MKRLLLLLGAAALLVAAPAMAQYIYLDSNGDGICDANDVLGPSSTNVDVYFDTNHNPGGGLVACSDGTSPLDIFSYQWILRSSGAGSVAYGTWTDRMAAQVPGGFLTPIANARGGTDIFVSIGGIVAGAPGLYRIGSLAITVTGSPALSFVETSSVDVGAVTAFGTHCPGNDFDGSQIFGRDFTGNCGTTTNTATRPTTWGAIKNLYR